MWSVRSANSVGCTRREADVAERACGVDCYIGTRLFTFYCIHAATLSRSICNKRTNDTRVVLGYVESFVASFFWTSCWFVFVSPSLRLSYSFSCSRIRTHNHVVRLQPSDMNKDTPNRPHKSIHLTDPASHTLVLGQKYQRGGGSRVGPSTAQAMDELEAFLVQFVHNPPPAHELFGGSSMSFSGSGLLGVNQKCKHSQRWWSRLQTEAEVLSTSSRSVSQTCCADRESKW